jgi:hypothetical protein
MEVGGVRSGRWRRGCREIRIRGIGSSAAAGSDDGARCWVRPPLAARRSSLDAEESFQGQIRRREVGESDPRVEASGRAEEFSAAGAGAGRVSE